MQSIIDKGVIQYGIFFKSLSAKNSISTIENIIWCSHCNHASGMTWECDNFERFSTNANFLILIWCDDICNFGCLLWRDGLTFFKLLECGSSSTKTDRSQ